MSPRRPIVALFAALACLGALSAGPSAPGAPAAASSAPVRQPRLVDFIAPPGTAQKLQPFMLHADLWLNLDQRSKLDTIVFVLDNGARCAQVMDRDSTWAVDYTWVYPHSLFPPRWYDAKSLFRTGDSLKLRDDADIQLTFGTLRTGVRAGSLKQATSEAYRLWPAEMPPALRGRLKLKLDRAKRALAGKPDAAPSDSVLR